MSATRPDVSIVIAALNSRLDLEVCLASIGAGGASTIETIVVDNGSSDGTIELLGRKYPEVRIVANAVNLGHCRAINQGLRVATGEFALVLDADTVLCPDALEHLLAFVRDHADVAVVAPRMLNA